MKNVGVNELKKYLKNRSSKELEEEIINLFKTFPEVKELYGAKLNPDSQLELQKKYKKIISKEFLPVGNRLSLKYKNCRDAIRDFNKVCENTELVADLMLHYAEEGVAFTNNFGDIDEQFYINIAKAYYSALEYIFDNKLEEKFRGLTIRIYFV